LSGRDPRILASWTWASLSTARSLPRLGYFRPDPARLPRRGNLLDGAPDPDAHYREKILPHKVAMDAAYLRNRSNGPRPVDTRSDAVVLLGRKIRLPAYVRTAIEEPTDA